MTAAIQTGVTGSQGMEQKHQTARPIDLVHLAKYTLGDTALEEEILGLFARQSQVYVGQLEKAASFKEWHAAAHTIKGSARSVGACHIADLAQQAEEISETGSADEKEIILTKMRKALVDVTTYIESLLGSRTQ